MSDLLAKLNFAMWFFGFGLPLWASGMIGDFVALLWLRFERAGLALGEDVIAI